MLNRAKHPVPIWRAPRLLSRLICLLVLLCCVPAGLAQAADKTILMITWRGQTQAEFGFIQRLKELGVDVDYEIFDAARDQNRLAGYLRENRDKLKTKDLIYTFGTTATSTVKNFNPDGIPHVFNIVANPVGVGIAASHASPAFGVTGAKMALSPEVNIQLLEQLYPFKKIAILFDPREDNAVSEVDKLTAVCEALGKEVIRLRLSPDAKSSKLQIDSLLPQLRSADVIYVTASSSFVAHEGLLEQILPQDIVSMGSSTAYINEGITLAFGTEYWERGEAVAEQAARILVDGASPNELPIDEIAANEAILYVNTHHQSVPKLRLNKTNNPIILK